MSIGCSELVFSIPIIVAKLSITLLPQLEGAYLLASFPCKTSLGKPNLKSCAAGGMLRAQDHLMRPSAFIGGGYFQGEGRFGFFILGLYNLNYSVYSPYSSPLIFRMGINLGL